ncbi:MAG: hypothetical protein OXK76_15760 [Gammaproteobacteria bacterium]|nr:hypothetical protein [Gammaproteobacteria bacterium]
MAPIHTERLQLLSLDPFARSVGREILAASKQKLCWVVLGLGLGNLLAGLVFSTADWLPTFVALDIVHANFACALWLVVIHLGVQQPIAFSGPGLAAKTTALAFVAGAMLTTAGIVASAYQLWRGDAPVDWPLYVAGTYANLGWCTLHLAMLAVAMRAIVGRRWPAIALTTAVWTATNLGFDHLLLRFGARIGPASGMNGFGPFLVPMIASGIHWTGFCIVLLAMGHGIAGRRCTKSSGTPRRPLGHNAFSLVWTAGVAWLVSGGWIVHQAKNHIRTDTQIGLADVPARDAPQPVYSRLALDITISPLERVLVSRGNAIAVNRNDAPIPELRFGIPPALQVDSLTLTGEPVGIDDPGGSGSRYLRYRLNRPLEPKETLKIEFVAKWIASDLANTRADARLVGNGTFVSTVDVIPALGGGESWHSAPPVAFRARIGTSLDQVALTAGTLVRAWKENGWSFFEYESEVPIPPLTTIHSGHYAVERDVCDEGTVEVFYHPPHRSNVDRMLYAGRTALSREGAALGTDVLVRVVEVPDYRSFRRLGLLGLEKTRLPSEAATGMVVPYSERGYPLNTPPPTGSTPQRA